ncbi:charged multivesicular body protein 7 [Culicoides brevitarsis]|uniref:charged multivesicular body protein 7 n=1 Tax=Culicoides brevitarsis TaxID=469753 RepID=UPI00307B1366
MENTKAKQRDSENFNSRLESFSQKLEQTESWNDEAKMGNYYAEFRPYQVNPENYEGKMRFWKQLIKTYCEHKGSAEFTIVELKKAFKRKNVSPYCLSKVIDEMLANQEIKLKDQFLEPPEATWSGWAMNLLVKKPLKWGINKVKEQVMTIRDETTSYVCSEVVNTQAEALHTLFEKSYDTILNKEDILSRAEKTNLSISGANLAMHRLMCENRLWMEADEANSKILCKFAAPNAKVTPATELEKSIYTLEETEKSLERTIDDLEKEINSTTTNIKQCLKDGRKQAAKNHLKKRHALEKNLEKRMGVLESVQTMLSRIHDTQKDKDVLLAYKIGTDALKNALAGSGITLDSVDETIEQMREAIEVHDDIQNSFAIPTKDVLVDDEDLEKELEDLLSENPSGGDTAGGKTSPPEKKTEENFDEDIEKRLKALSFDVPELSDTEKSLTASTVPH